MKLTKTRLKRVIKEELKAVLSEKATQIALEGGMPSSVAAAKKKLADMSDKEFADKHGHKSEEQLRQMAWRHGYGKMSDHYVKRLPKTVKEELTKGWKSPDELARDYWGGWLEGNDYISSDLESIFLPMSKGEKPDPRALAATLPFLAAEDETARRHYARNWRTEMIKILKGAIENPEQYKIGKGEISAVQNVLRKMFDQSEPNPAYARQVPGFEKEYTAAVATEGLQDEGLREMIADFVAQEVSGWHDVAKAELHKHVAENGFDISDIVMNSLAVPMQEFKERTKTKVTKQRLSQIIKEEVEKVVKEDLSKLDPEYGSKLYQRAKGKEEDILDAIERGENWRQISKLSNVYNDDYDFYLHLKRRAKKKGRDPSEDYASRS